MNETPLRVVFAEDNYLVREGTAALLREIPDIELLAVVDNPEALVDAVDRHHPDLVLTDIRMPPTHTNEGIEAANRIRARYPEIGVVLLSQYAEQSYLKDLMGQGGDRVGYLLKERVRDVEDLVAAMRTVHRGGMALDPKIMEEFVAARRGDSGFSQLTDREHQVLEQMAMGKTNSAIAKTLYLSERSVERHINSVFSKLGLSEEKDIHRRVKAVVTFLESKSPSSS